MDNKDKTPTKVEETERELGSFRKLSKKNLPLACGIAVVVTIMALAWIGPKTWDLVKIMANPDLAELRQRNVILASKVEELQTATNTLSSELSRRTQDRDAKSDQLASANSSLVEMNAELKQRTHERDAKDQELTDLKNTAFSIRVGTFNNHEAAKRVTVAEIVRSDTEVFADLTKLPGFDDDQGIARRLWIGR